MLMSPAIMFQCTLANAANARNDVERSREREREREPQRERERESRFEKQWLDLVSQTRAVLPHV